MTSCIEPRTATRFENHFQHNDGTEDWFQICISPVTEGLFILSLDITDTKVAEAKLKTVAVLPEPPFEFATAMIRVF